MLIRLAGLAAILMVHAPTRCNGHSIDFSAKCYQGLDPALNMPRTLDNLLGLLNVFDNTSSQFNTISQMSEMLINEFRSDGYIFYNDHYTRSAKEKSKNIFVVDVLIRPTELVPLDTYDVREQCGLHMLLSHSIDHFPFAGVDDIWDGTIDRAGRERRQLMFAGDEEILEDPAVQRSSYSQQLGYDIPLDQIAEHPTENGVMETAYGPVAAGTLLTGLINLDSDDSFRISSLKGVDTDDVPSEVQSKEIRPLYAATLSGDMGELALFAMNTVDINTIEVGPTGRYNNCTTCAKQFSLERETKTFVLTRAELYAGLDALIIKQGYDLLSGEIKNKMTLSQLLKFYYSEKGLPDLPEYKACNRMHLYAQLDTEMIYEQALNYMYAFVYQNPLNVPFHDKVIANRDNFGKLDTRFREYADKVKSVVEGFINGGHPTDEGYAACQILSDIAYHGPASETVADVVFVYGEQQPIEYRARNQRQMIGDVARRLRYDAQQTAVGVMGSPSGQWIVPVTNFTNIGDWACNFTADYDAGGNGGSNNQMLQNVFQELSTFYSVKKLIARTDENSASGRSQVVVWQVPDSLTYDDSNNATVEFFRYNFPDVRIIFVGNSDRHYLDSHLMKYEDDFVVTANKNIDQVTAEVLKKVHDSPRPFMYPRCGNSTLLEDNENYREENHVYHGAVTPGYTTFIEMPASAFMYSRNITIKVSGAVNVCVSRTNRFALTDFTASLVYEENYIVRSEHDVLRCAEQGGEIYVEYPCDQYLETCNPIFLSITGNGTYAGCTGDNTVCDMPNQIKYELSHLGMTCGASPTHLCLLVMLLPVLLLRLTY